MFKNKLLVIFISILVFSFGVRIFKITEPDHYYFDEVYHVVTAKAHSQNNPAAYDPYAPAPEPNTAFDWLHPPLAKLIQAASIKTVGDSPLGWRLPSAIFGTGIVAATFVLGLLLFGPAVGVFAASVIALENLNVVMSRITMNDVFITFFTLCSFIFAYIYINPKRFRELAEGSRFWSRLASKNDSGGLLYLFLTSVFLGFAVSSKWTGMYAILAVGIFILLNKIKKKHFDLRLLLLVVVPPLIYLLSYGQFWLQGHSIQQFKELHKQIWWYQNRHDLQHAYGTTSLYCVPNGLEEEKTFCPWILDIRGTYFSYEQYDDKAGYIYAIGNPLVFWAGIVAVSFLIGKYFETKKKEYALALLGYFIFWVPWIFSPRILFLHHYLPSLPFLAVASGVVLAMVWKSKFRLLAFLILFLMAAMFFFLYPISAGLPIKIEDIDKYMILGTWR